MEEQYSGEVVYLYAFDVAHELSRQLPSAMFGQPVIDFTIDASKRSPRQYFFYRPKMVRLPPVERVGPRGAVRVDRTVRNFTRAPMAGMIASAPSIGCPVRAATVNNTPTPMRQVMNQPAFSHCDGDPVQICDSSDRGASLGGFETGSVIHDSW